MFNRIPLRYDLTDASIEILTMLLGAFLLGLLLGYILFKCRRYCCLEGMEAETEVISATVPKKAKATSSSKKDDLKVVEGVGPKIEQLLNADGIKSFSQLANANPSRLKKVLDEAGPRFKMHNPKTWPKQALMAQNGQWDKLEKYQDRLNAGRA